MTLPHPFLQPELAHETVLALVARLADDTRHLVEAEIAVHKVRLGERITAYKTAAIFFAAAGVLALVGLIALLVGLILTLATLVGPGWATLIVAGTVLAAAAILGVVGKSRLAPTPVPAT